MAEKRVSDRSKDYAVGTAAGVGTTMGLIGGGLPGKKVRPKAIDTDWVDPAFRVKERYDRARREGAGQARAAKEGLGSNPVKAAARAGKGVLDFGGGGIFGFRHEAHKKHVADLKADKARQFTNTGKTKEGKPAQHSRPDDLFRRGIANGGIPAEERIVRHLRTGRLAFNGLLTASLAGGAGYFGSKKVLGDHKRRREADAAVKRGGKDPVKKGMPSSLKRKRKLMLAGKGPSEVPMSDAEFTRIHQWEQGKLAAGRIAQERKLRDKGTRLMAEGDGPGMVQQLKTAYGRGAYQQANRARGLADAHIAEGKEAKAAIAEHVGQRMAARNAVKIPAQRVGKSAASREVAKGVTSAIKRAEKSGDWYSLSVDDLNRYEQHRKGRDAAKRIALAREWRAAGHRPESYNRLVESAGKDIVAGKKIKRARKAEDGRTRIPAVLQPNHGRGSRKPQGILEQDTWGRATPVKKSRKKVVQFREVASDAGKVAAEAMAAARSIPPGTNGEEARRLYAIAADMIGTGKTARTKGRIAQADVEGPADYDDQLRRLNRRAKVEARYPKIPQQKVRKSEGAGRRAYERANGVMLGAGLTAGVGGALIAPPLEREAKKWERENQQRRRAAQEKVGGLSGKTRAFEFADDEKNFEGVSNKTAYEAGKDRGYAKKARYFGAVYGDHAKVLRALRIPGLATAAVGGGGMVALNQHDKKKNESLVPKSDRVKS